jgi:leucyl-tRNA synthetase
VPHICSYLWTELGHENLIIYEKWPSFEKDLMIDEIHEIVIQINGKLKARINVMADIDEEALTKLALSEAKITQVVGQKEIKKTIIVPGKLINIVI